jgi:ribosome-associated protein
MEPLDLAHLCVEIARDKKCEDVLLLDVGRTTVLADYFLIATARNRRQLRAVGEGIARAASKEGCKARHVEGAGGERWVLLDLGDVVVHVFDAEARSFYDLESLWADAPRVALASDPATRVSAS